MEIILFRTLVPLHESMLKATIYHRNIKIAPPKYENGYEIVILPFYTVVKIQKLVVRWPISYGGKYNNRSKLADI